MDLAEAEEFEEAAVVPLKAMVYGVTGHTYVALSKPEGALSLGKFTNVMRFKVVEVDPNNPEEVEEEGYEDEYQLEDLEVSRVCRINVLSTHVLRRHCMSGVSVLRCKVVPNNEVVEEGCEDEYHLGSNMSVLFERLEAIWVPKHASHQSRVVCSGLRWSWLQTMRPRKLGMECTPDWHYQLDDSEVNSL